MTKNFTNIAYEFWDIVFVKIKVLALPKIRKQSQWQSQLQ